MSTTRIKLVNKLSKNESNKPSEPPKTSAKITLNLKVKPKVTQLCLPELIWTQIIAFLNHQTILQLLLVDRSLYQLISGKMNRYWYPIYLNRKTEETPIESFIYSGHISDFVNHDQGIRIRDVLNQMCQEGLLCQIVGHSDNWLRNTYRVKDTCYLTRKDLTNKNLHVYYYNVTYRSPEHPIYNLKYQVEENYFLLALEAGYQNYKHRILPTYREHLRHFLQLERMVLEEEITLKSFNLRSVDSREARKELSTDQKNHRHAIINKNGVKNYQEREKPKKISGWQLFVHQRNESLRDKYPYKSRRRLFSDCSPDWDKLSQTLKDDLNKQAEKRNKEMLEEFQQRKEYVDSNIMPDTREVKGRITSDLLLEMEKARGKISPGEYQKIVTNWKDYQSLYVKKAKEFNDKILDLIV